VKLATIRMDGGAPTVGVVRDDRVTAIDDVPDMRSLFELGDAGMEMARRAAGPEHALEDVALEPPIVPKKFFHTSGNFREHEEESKRVDWSHEIAPWIVFFQNVDSLVGPDQPIIYPNHLTSELDYEIELCVVIGKAGKHFGSDSAGDYIAGFTIFNDITARDIQREEMRSGTFSFCKAIDTFGPLGPWIVTPDELPDPRNLEITLTVNGEVRQESNTSHMSVSLDELVAHYSPLSYSAGDIVSTGTVSGVAGFREDAEDYYLRPGDFVECEIEGIGRFGNPVLSWEEAYGEPPPSRPIQPR
jgi:2-keto-4-pentenoate hydratase/2-oxohepta-3-ene-1,7-dioic acid hydratase in catechol pathway